MTESKVAKMRFVALDLVDCLYALTIYAAPGGKLHAHLHLREFF